LQENKNQTAPPITFLFSAATAHKQCKVKQGIAGRTVPILKPSFSTRFSTELLKTFTLRQLFFRRAGEVGFQIASAGK
jgi:hypothetical protein